MIERFFRLSENNTNLQREVLCGLTTFLTMMYILFANSNILAEIGMPWNGVFIATALSAGICTVFISIYSNLPFAMAPGMGMNTVFSYTICMSMGYHWKEALAITFLAGLLTLTIMITPLRKAFVNSFPEYLRVASGVGLGMFIAYIGLKNAGLLAFTSRTGEYEQLADGTIIGSSSTIPSIVSRFTSAQVVAVIGLVVMIVLMALERKTGDRYAALPIGILVATFIGIPLNVTQLLGSPSAALPTTDGYGQIFFSFFGQTGVFSIFSSPVLASRTLLMICILSMTSILDSVGTMIGIGQIDSARLFGREDMGKFARSGARSKLDRALIANAVGSTISPLLGTSSTTVFLESVTGIISGGRTGLTGVVVGLAFLICLPASRLFHIIPGAAVAPALVLAGVSMTTRVRVIDWKNIEEGFPAFMTILVTSLTYNILDGIATGILCHVIIQVTLGKRRDVHPILFAVSILYCAIKLGESLVLV